MTKKRFKIGESVQIKSNTRYKHSIPIGDIVEVINRGTMNIISLTYYTVKDIIGTSHIVCQEDLKIEDMVDIKIGDTVKIALKSGIITHHFNVGDEGKVLSLAGRGSNRACVVQVKRVTQTVNIKDLQLVVDTKAEPEVKFSMGDTVKVKGNKSKHYFRVGTVGEVVKDLKTGHYIVKSNEGACWALASSDIRLFEAPKPKPDGKRTRTTKTSASTSKSKSTTASR